MRLSSQYVLPVSGFGKRNLVGGFEQLKRFSARGIDVVRYVQDVSVSQHNACAYKVAVWRSGSLSWKEDTVRLLAAWVCEEVQQTLS